jgi:DNA-binding MarR family transcriptional regulator
VTKFWNGRWLITAAEFVRDYPGFAEEVADEYRRQHSDVPHGLTPRQLECMKFISSYVDQNGHAPTMNQIAAALGLKSRSGAHRIIESLIERGWLARVNGLHRSLAVIRKP